MSNQLRDEQRKKGAKCQRVMPCDSCIKLKKEFGREKLDAAFDILGSTAAIVEIRGFIIQHGLCPEA